jgi:hypothetical protein
MNERMQTSCTILIAVVFLYPHMSLAQLQKPGIISMASRHLESARVQPKGHLYSQITYGYHSSDSKFTTLGFDAMGDIISLDSGNTRIKAPDFTAHTITYHGAYGITDRLTIFLGVPWIHSKYEFVRRYTDKDGPDGIGDIDIGIKHLITDNLSGDGIFLSAQVILKIPEAYDFYYPLTSVSLGDGQYDAEFDLLLGKDWGRSYTVFQAGFTYRFENTDFDPVTFKPSDEIRILIGGGFNINSRFAIRGSLDWIKSLENAEVSDALILSSYTLGGLAWHGDKVLIKDTLGIEQNILNAGVAAQYDVTNKLGATIALNKNIKGLDGIGTENAADITTFSLVLSYVH